VINIEEKIPVLEVLKYTNRKIQENQMGLQKNWTTSFWYSQMTLIQWAITCILQRKTEVLLIVGNKGGPDVDFYIPSQKVIISYHADSYNIL
jgi:hypothetical protein